MTIINGIEIDFIRYKPNAIKSAIENNEPIEEKLHMIAVVSNPCLYAKRYILMKEFIHRIETEEPNVILYVVELAYKNQKFMITDAKNKRHLQLRTETPLWHKENMINVGVKHLLPANFKAFAWVDADVEFDSPTWAMDTLKVLNGTKDVVQLFSHCVDMDKDEMVMSVFNSAGYKLMKNSVYCPVRGINYSHPGFAWAITRKAYEKVGGLYDKGILGSGDFIMLIGLMGVAQKYISSAYHEDYKQSILEFEQKAKHLRLGYIPGVIRHYFHGSKVNRRYQDRNQILRTFHYSPKEHTQLNAQGLIEPSPAFAEEFKEEIYQYFLARNEDEGCT